MSKFELNDGDFKAESAWGNVYKVFANRVGENVIISRMYTASRTTCETNTISYSKYIEEVTSCGGLVAAF